MESFERHLSGRLTNALCSKCSDGFTGFDDTAVDLFDIDIEEQLQLQICYSMERVPQIELVSFILAFDSGIVLLEVHRLLLEVFPQLFKQGVLESLIQSHNFPLANDLVNVLRRLLPDFLGSEIFLLGQVGSQQIFCIFLQAFQIDRVFVLLALHWIQTIVSVPKLNDFLAITGSYSVVIHHPYVFNQLYETPLHIACIGRFDCSIDDTLSASHGMEKKLSCRKARKKAVLDKPSRFWRLDQPGEVRQRSLSEPVCDSFSSDCLLPYTTDHLTEVDRTSLAAAQSHD